MAQPIVRVSGKRFINPDGSTWKYVGVSSFALWRKWLEGKGPAVQPVLNSIRDAARTGGYGGPIVLRVFRYAAPPNAFAVAPWSYPFAEVTAFTNYLDAAGFYVDWTSGDSQIVIPAADGPNGQQQHLNEFCAALVGTTNAFVQTSNEPFKNGVDVGAVIPPKWGSYLISSGAYSDSNSFRPDQPPYDFVDFHPDRSVEQFPEGQVEKWLGKLFESAVYLNRFSTPIIYGEPIGADEFDIPGRRSSNTEAFRRAGLAVAFTAGVTFHSTDGLSSAPFRPVTFGCLVHFFHGAQKAIEVER